MNTCNTCICNHLCVLVCVCLLVGQNDFQLCSSEVLHLDFWLEFPTKPGACRFNEPPACPCYHLNSQPTVGSCCVGVEVSGPHDCTVSTYSLSHIHSPPHFLWDGNSLRCLSWPWTYTVTQAGLERAFFSASAHRVDRILGLVNVIFCLFNFSGAYMYVVFYCKWKF